jgi:hypothetical protein
LSPQHDTPPDVDEAQYDVSPSPATEVALASVCAARGTPPPPRTTITLIGLVLANVTPVAVRVKT